jgi:hypothetical protein
MPREDLSHPRAGAAKTLNPIKILFITTFAAQGAFRLANAR